MPLSELKEFENILNRITGALLGYYALSAPPIDRLRIPLEELREYERTVDRILYKLQQNRYLKPGI